MTSAASDPENRNDIIFALATPPGVSGVAVIRLSGPGALDAIRPMLGSVHGQSASRRADLSDQSADGRAEAFTIRPRYAHLVDIFSREKNFYDALSPVALLEGKPFSGPQVGQGPVGAEKKHKQKLDTGLLLWFPAPHSFTGEEVVELQLHGSRAVLDRVQSELGSLALPGDPQVSFRSHVAESSLLNRQAEGAGAPGPDEHKKNETALPGDGEDNPSSSSATRGRTNIIRPAQPGEFTRRAFHNGRMDLVEAEALADLLHAETDAQRVQAQLLGSPAQRQRYADWKTRLLRLMAHAEATIDFSDEELPDDLADQVQDRLGALAAELAGALDQATLAERVRDGIRIVLAGAPNAGKSSLLNALAKRDVAIVTDQAGTTRDLVEVQLDLAGFPVTLVDTAGLRETDDLVEAEGIRRAEQAVRNADLTLWLEDLSAADVPSPGPQAGGVTPLPSVSSVLKQESSLFVESGDSGDAQTFPREKKLSDVLPSFGILEREIFSREKVLPDALKNSGQEIWVLGTKADLAIDDEVKTFPREKILRISTRTGDGLRELTDALAARIAEKYSAVTESPAHSRLRQRAELESMHQALLSAQQAPLPELLAEDIRAALAALGRLTGHIDVEQVLDVVFSDFCIGK